MPRASHCGIRWFVIVLLATLLVASAALLVAPASAEPAADKAEQAEGEATGGTEEKESGDEEGGLAKKIDEGFGKWLVAPLETVLFYDFGTEKRLGAKVPFVVIWLLAGATFFTVRMGFINFRA